MLKLLTLSLAVALIMPVKALSNSFELTGTASVSSDIKFNSNEETILNSVFRIDLPTEIKNGDTLNISLQNTLIFSGTVIDASTNINKTRSVVAKQIDSDYSTLMLSCTDNLYYGSLDLPEKKRFYEISSSKNQSGNYCFSKVLPDREFADAPTVSQTTHSGINQHRVPNNNSKSLKTDTAVVDIMILYTPRAKAWADSAAGSIDNVIAQAVARGNLALNNSNTLMKINLVHSGMVNYTEFDPGTDLYRMTYHEGYDPDSSECYPRYLEEVHTLRDQYKADVVTLFERISGVGGMGWMLKNPAGKPESAFSVCRVQQVATGYTMIHEMGHNMGCQHRKDQDDKTEPGVFSYSAGWRWIGADGNRYASVMSYTEAWNGQPVTRVGHFSNPDIQYQSVPTGDAADGDNARTLREMRHVIEDYRDNTGIDDCTSLRSAELLQNYPNPFNPSTTINFSLSKKEFAQICVYNIKGELVADLGKKIYDAGFNSIEFNAGALNSGSYFYQLKTGDLVTTKKMIIIK